MDVACSGMQVGPSTVSQQSKAAAWAPGAVEDICPPVQQCHHTRCWRGCAPDEGLRGQPEEQRVPGKSSSVGAAGVLSGTSSAVTVCFVPRQGAGSSPYACEAGQHSVCCCILADHADKQHGRLLLPVALK